MRKNGSARAVVLLPLLTFMLTTACSGGNNEPATVADNQSPAMEMEVAGSVFDDFAHQELIVLEEVYPTPPAFDSQLWKAISDYLQLKEAFISADLSKIENNMRQLRISIEGVDFSLLEGKAVEAWGSHRKVLLASLDQMEKVGNLEAKRLHFSHISEAVYCSARSFNPDGGRLFTAYCPMALNSRGAYWLSDSREIRNPYLGQEMQSCGEVREVIN